MAYRWILVCWGLVLLGGSAFAHSNAYIVADIGRFAPERVETGTAIWGQIDWLDSLVTDTPKVSLGGKGTRETGNIPIDLVAPSDSMRALVAGADSVLSALRQDSLGIDSAAIVAAVDSLLQDSLFQGLAIDTTWVNFSPDALPGNVSYEARDSILYDITAQMVYLYGDAQVIYDTYQMNAAFITFSWANQTVKAWGFTDSTGTDIGKPVFVDGDQGFSADTVRFNFRTGQGKIHNMRGEEQGGFVGFEEAKRNQYEEIFGARGYYTTCSDPDPHFHIQANKVKLVPDKLVVTGPANLVIADVPTPLFLPFAIFPLEKGRKSGVLLPEYGESQGLGFYLRNGGWYFALSEYWDLALTGDIYTRGSWRVNAATNYRQRYRFSGRVTANYANTRFGFPDADGFRVTRDFKITWNHNQDPKARPNSRFTANVTAGTSTYLSNAVQNNDDFLNNSFTSNVTYSRSFPGKPYRLDASIQHNQILAQRSIDLTLPKVVFAVNRVYPFERAVSTGQSKWYEKIGVSYTTEVRNQISTVDSLLFRSQTLDAMRYGMRHTLPVNFAMPIFKHFTFSVNATYNENWYPNYIQRSFVLDSVYNEADSAIGFGFVRTDTLNGFRAARFFNASASISTQLFSLVQFRGRKLKAIRHVMTPALTASYTPDFGTPFWNYYGEYATNLEGDRQVYSKFANGLFGGPGMGRQGSLGFSLNNTVQAKVFSKKDTVNREKKIQIIDALGISGSYNFAADSFQWNDIRITGRTRLLDRIDINFSGNFDPYSRDSAGTRQQESQWKANRRPLRFRSGTLAMGTRLSGGSSAAGRERPSWLAWDVWDPDPGYYDFTVPWSLALNYNLTVRSLVGANGNDSITTTQTITFNGDFNLTPKWKVNFQSGYDFQSQDFSYTTIGINRDLHCWQMAFNWVPFGTRRSYNFTLNVKSAILQQLRINRRQDWVDDF